MNSRWLRRYPWILLILVGIVFALWRRSARSESPQVLLIDGSILRLEGIKYKSKSAALPWHRWIEQGRQWLAEALGRPSLNDAFAPPDSLVFWISRLDKHTGKPVQPPSGWSVVAVDSHGCKFGIAETGLGPGNLRRIGRRQPLAAASLPVFPRRERFLTLRFLESSLPQASLKVPNPAYRRYPIWTAESLPAARPLGASNITLVNFDNVWGALPFGSAFQQKVFTLTPEFRMPAEWELDDLNVEDATGNSSALAWAPKYGPSPRMFRHRRPWEPVSAQFELCTNESAWKLTATLRRNTEAKFDSNEVWTIPNLQIPRPGKLRNLSVSNSWQGITVRLCAIAGPAEVTYSNGIPVLVSEFKPRTQSMSSNRMPGVPPVTRLIPVASDKPQLLMHVSGLDGSVRLQTTARTPNGDEPCGQRMRSGDYFVIDLTPVQDASSADLSLIAQHAQTVEFLIAPKARVDHSPAGSLHPPLRPLPSPSERRRFSPLPSTLQ
jgi:hypothetical protein